MPPSAVSSTYRSAPLLLNLERDPTSGLWALASTWCNLGLWPAGSGSAGDGGSFQHACEALALRVGEAARLQPGDTVLDVGVGYADQTALWATRFRAARVVAVEPSRPHVAEAREAQAAGRLAGGSVVELHVGSADELPACCSAPVPIFDACICLDCAYHFRSRGRFLQKMGTLLRPGGRFAAADLIVAEREEEEDQEEAGQTLLRGNGGILGMLRSWLGSQWRVVARRLVATLCDIPAVNLHGAVEYKQSLHAAGLVSVEIEPISERVLLPFAAHAHRQRAALRGQLRYGESAFLWIIALLFGYVARHRLFDVVLVRACKPTTRELHAKQQYR